MTIKSFKADEARTKLRDILDDVMAGREIVIERYAKPIGVIIPYAQWQAFKRQRKERHDRIRKEMDAGEYYTTAQVEAMLKADGLLP